MEMGSFVGASLAKRWIGGEELGRKAENEQMRKGGVMGQATLHTERLAQAHLHSTSLFLSYPLMFSLHIRLSPVSPIDLPRLPLAQGTARLPPRLRTAHRSRLRCALPFRPKERSPPILPQLVPLHQAGVPRYGQLTFL